MKEILYNGVSSTTIRGLRIKNWSRQFFPQSRDVLEEIEGQDGFVFTPKPLGRKRISITFIGRFSDESERIALIDNVTKWLYSDQLGNLVLGDEPDKYYLGKVIDDTNIEPSYYSGEFTVTFTCQPLKYGNKRDEILLNSSIFTNYGTYVDKNPEVGIILNEDSEVLTITVNETELSYEGPMIGSGSTIKIKDLEFRIDNDLKIFEVDGYFPVIDPGENRIDIDVSAELSVRWQELYL